MGKYFVKRPLKRAPVHPCEIKERLNDYQWR